MRYIFFMTVATVGLTLASCANRPYQVSHTHTDARLASVCDIAHWNKSMVGTYVQVQAEYVTDFHHGAFLSDDNCPHDSLPIGRDAANVGNSISTLEKYMGRHFKYFLSHGIKVDVIGIYIWEKGHIINKDLPLSRQVRTSGHGAISLVEIRNFAKIKK